jgi:hypothetical protein
MSAALLAAFLARGRRSANPVIDPALFWDGHVPRDGV